MRRSLVLTIALTLLVGLPLAASAAQPQLSAADKAAVGRIFTGVSTLNPKLATKARKALSDVTGQYTRSCKPKYAKETQAHKQVIANALVLMTYLRFVRIGYPLWAAFSSWAEGVAVSHPQLRQAKSVFSLERAQGVRIAAVRFDVCGSVAELARASFTDSAANAWAGRLMSSTGVDQHVNGKADAKIRASRPALLAAGLTSKQAKLMMDTETGDIFSVMLGIG
jgi:hypothetical protein